MSHLEDTMYAHQKIVKLGVSTLLALALAAIFLAEPAFSAPKKSGEKGTLLAQEKRTKKKNKRKKKPEDAQLVVDAPASDTAHPEQEGPVDELYSWDVSLLSDLAINNEQVGDAKTGTADYDLNLKALRVVTPSVEVGGEVTFDESSRKTEDETNTTRAYVIGLRAVYNFGDLNRDKTIFFASLGVGFGGTSAKVAGEESKGSLTQYGLGLGVHYFMDSNVALTGQLSYDMGERKMDGVDEPVKFSSMHLARIGFSLFL